MVLVRRRYYTWLVRAYIKRWKKTILTSLLLGGIVFFLFLLALKYYVFPIFNNSIEKIGYAGSYTIATLPPDILDNVSYGLTRIEPDGKVHPAAAASWNVSQDGLKYTFKLKHLTLSNGKPFSINDLPYSFGDVKKEIVSTDEVKFTLKNKFSPFLSVVSTPILVKNHGFNPYHIEKIEQNSGFIKSLTLENKDRSSRKVFYFYPTENALQTAFMLGEVNVMKNVSSDIAPENSFAKWENVDIQKHVNYDELVSIFFNTTDSTLSNKKIRQALVYAMPESFSQGERAFSFISPHSLYYSKSPNEGVLDMAVAKQLMESGKAKDVKITLSTPEELTPVAQKVAKSWEKIGVKTTIKIVNDVPSDYQALLFTMKIPKDPDTYAIWHAGQKNNITNYNNTRINKLLEDGRQTIDTTRRVQIYSDVQKYLLDDAPAAFLYFPYNYTIIRK